MSSSNYSGSKGQSSISPSRQNTAVSYVSKSPTYYTSGTSPQQPTIKKTNVNLPY